MPEVRSLDQGTVGNGFKEWFRLGAAVVVLLVVSVSPMREVLHHASEIAAFLDRAGWKGAVFFVLGMTGLVAVGVPRMLIYPIGGLAFGFAEGLVCGLIATVGGGYATFRYARWAGQQAVLRRWPGVGKASPLMHNGHGVLAVALIRQLPSPGFLTSMILGLSPVGGWAFVAGTALGSLPLAVPATLAGGSLVTTNAEARISMLVSALLCLLLVGAVSVWHVRRIATSTGS